MQKIFIPVWFGRTGVNRTLISSLSTVQINWSPDTLTCSIWCKNWSLTSHMSEMCPRVTVTFYEQRQFVFTGEEKDTKGRNWGFSHCLSLSNNPTGSRNRLFFQGLLESPGLQAACGHTGEAEISLVGFFWGSDHRLWSLHPSSFNTA